MTGKEKSQWKLESFLENKTTDERYYHFLFHFFPKKIVVHGDFTDQFKLSCPYHVFNRLHPTPALTSGGKKGNRILNIYTRTQKDFSVLLMFLLL